MRQWRDAVTTDPDIPAKLTPNRRSRSPGLPSSTYPHRRERRRPPSKKEQP